MSNKGRKPFNARDAMAEERKAVEDAIRERQEKESHQHQGGDLTPTKGSPSTSKSKPTKPANFSERPVLDFYQITHKSVIEARMDGERYMQGLLLRWAKEQKDIKAGQTRIIADKSIQMILPRGADKLDVGQAVYIKWKTEGEIPFVRITLYKGWSLSLIIANSTANSGLYRWVIPEVFDRTASHGGPRLPEGDDGFTGDVSMWTVKVSDANNASRSDFSGRFSIRKGAGEAVGDGNFDGVENGKQMSLSLFLEENPPMTPPKPTSEEGMVDPSGFYQQVQVCRNCYKVYKRIDKERTKHRTALQLQQKIKNGERIHDDISKMKWEGATFAPQEQATVSPAVDTASIPAVPPAGGLGVDFDSYESVLEKLR